MHGRAQDIHNGYSKSKKIQCKTEGSKFVQYRNTYTKVDKLFNINRKVDEFSTKIILKQINYMIICSILNREVKKYSTATTSPQNTREIT
jgi:hypothetical protein